VITTETASQDLRAALTDRGVEVHIVPADAAGRVDLAAMALVLGGIGYTTVLCEGGGTLAGGLLQAHLVDQAWVVQSRRVLLGGGGPGWTEGLAVESVARAPRLSRVSERRLGPDTLLTVIPESAQWWDPETLGAEAPSWTAPRVHEPAGA
jgi:diaminohydroxyphosphoribosylaminopyrimidine deaminase/5-amino-6-(5-phosphoribosylamino)uracil reductase